RQTDAGHAFDAAVGSALAQTMSDAGGVLAYERAVAQVAASGPDFLTFAVGNGAARAPVTITVTDAQGRQLRDGEPATLPGAFLMPFGDPSTSPVLGALTALGAAPYTLTFHGRDQGALDLSVTIPRSDGFFSRGSVSSVGMTSLSQAQIVVNPA